MPHVHIDALCVAIADSEIPETDAETTVRWFTGDDLHTAPDISGDVHVQAQAILATAEEAIRSCSGPARDSTKPNSG